MTPKKWSNVFGALIVVIGFVIPLFFIFSMYMSLETTTTKMALGIIGVFATVGIIFGLLKWLKKRIKIRQELGFKVSPYVILASHTFGSVSGVIVFTWFLSVVKGEIDTLFRLMIIWSVCAFLAFILKFVQVHFDILDKQQNP